MDARAHVSKHGPPQPLADRLPGGQIHAPNGRIDLSLLLRGAEVPAYLWEDLAGLT